jgi:hypothetical protein
LRDAPLLHYETILGASKRTYLPELNLKKPL